MNLITIFILVQIVLILINGVKRLITKDYKFNVLGCGLIGYVGNKPPDLLKIALLIKYNEERGNQATGICLDGAVYKKVMTPGRFLREFNTLFLNPPEKYRNFTVLAHDRQASSGSKDREDLAHPHVVYANQEEKKSPLLVGVHNGTINNISDLAEKYDVPYKMWDNSDSQVLFKIMSKYKDEKAFQVLSEIGGYATILFYPTKEVNTLYVHRDPDRQLYYYQGDGFVYVSSLEDSLYAIGGSKETVFEFEPNKVFKFTAGELTNTWDLPKRERYFHRKTTHYHSSDDTYNRAPKNDYFAKARSAVNNYTELQTIKGRIRAENAKEEKKNNGLNFFKGKYEWNGHAYTGYLYANSNGDIFTTESDAKKDGRKYKTFTLIGGFLTNREADYLHLLTKFADDKGVFDIRKFEDASYMSVKDYMMYPMPLKTPGHYVEGSPVLIPNHLDDKIKGQKLIEISFLFSNRKLTISPDHVVMKYKAVQEVNFPSFPASLSIKEALCKVFENEYDILEDFKTVLHKVSALTNLNFESENASKIIAELLDLAKDDEVITENIYNQIKNSAGVKELGTDNLLESVDKVVVLYANYYQEFLESQKYAITDIPFESDSFSDEPVDEMSIENVIKAEVESPLYSQKSFYDAITYAQYDTIEDILISYAMDDTPEVVRPVLVAISKVLVDVGSMTTAELNKVINDKLTRALSVVKCGYKLYLGMQDEKGEKPMDTMDSPVEFGLEGSIAQFYNLLKTNSGIKAHVNVKYALQTLLSEKEKDINKIALKQKYGIEISDIKQILD